MLLAILGLFLFNGCNDEDPQPIQQEGSGTISTLKSYTGISIQQAKTRLEADGYIYIKTETYRPDLRLHVFGITISNTIYGLLEASSTVIGCSYSEQAEKEIALSLFETFSKECIEYMLDKTYKYSGFVKILDEEGSIYTNRQTFKDNYESNKLNINYCYEMWETTNDRLITEYSYDYEEFGEVAFSYLNIKIVPEELLNNKLIVNKIHNK